jgi:very-short-patch-repair endonuclease/predicted transcriptional regulator of viral defense system
MPRSNSDPRSAEAWAVAGRQHGIVSRRQLLELGFTAEAIDHRVAKGRLHRISRGIYAVGWPGLHRERRWMVAILACGPEALLSHRSAAALWGIGGEHREVIDVTVRRRCEHRRVGINARSRPTLPPEDVSQHVDIPVTSPERTLVDLATELTASELERAVNEADKLDLVKADALMECLPRFAGQPGVRALRALLNRHVFRLSDSELERLFRRIATRSGLSVPRTKAHVNGFEVDFFWPHLGLVVETDGLRYHRTPLAQARDRQRDQTHIAAGLLPLRFTHHQVKYEPSRVREVLERTARRRTDRSVTSDVGFDFDGASGR